MLTGGEKLQAGCLATIAVFGCGPFLFIPVALVLFLPVSLILGDGMPDWLGTVLLMFAAIITIVLVVGVAVNKVQEDKQKRIIHEAEFRRAQKELDGKG